MRYMMLIYSQEVEGGLAPEEREQLRASHWAVINAAGQRGILLGAEPLSPTSSATTVRVNNGKPLITDGPFAETKEQLAGYYIMECENLDDAIEWAAKIPTTCRGSQGCIEIRPMPGLPPRIEAGTPAGQAAARHG